MPRTREHRFTCKQSARAPRFTRVSGAPTRAEKAGAKCTCPPAAILSNKLYRRCSISTRAWAAGWLGAWLHCLFHACMWIGSGWNELEWLDRIGVKCPESMYPIAQAKTIIKVWKTSIARNESLNRYQRSFRFPLLLNCPTASFSVAYLLFRVIQ